MRSLSVTAKVLIACVLVGFGLMIVFGQKAQVAEHEARVDVMRGNELIASFDVELAVTSEQQVRGLMGREHLPEGTGMLFVFPRSGHIGMWMKNMLISLDFLFIDENFRIVHTEEHIEPCTPNGPCPTIAASVPIKYVLEIPAGTIADLGITINDTTIVTAPSLP